jgi:hypothetical protein
MALGGEDWDRAVRGRALALLPVGRLEPFIGERDLGEKEREPAFLAGASLAPKDSL